MCAVMEATHACIPLSAGTSFSGKQKSCSLPGWKENVKPAKSDSLFWHSVSLSAGRPPSGALHNLMCWTRNKFHYAVRRAKRQAEMVKSSKLMEAAEQGNMALYREMKSTLSGKTSGQTVPESLDGKVTHETILDRFREFYELH